MMTYNIIYSNFDCYCKQRRVVFFNNSHSPIAQKHDVMFEQNK